MTKKQKAEEITNPVLFDPQTIGRSMEEVEVDVIQTSNQEVVSYWYHGQKNSDIFVWIDESKNIIKQQVIYCGQVVEWNILEGIRTGWVFDDEAQKSESNEIHYDEAVMSVAVRQALTILNNTECFEVTFKKHLIKNLEESPQISKMSSKQVLELFGENFSPKAKKTWWKKLFDWFT